EQVVRTAWVLARLRDHRQAGGVAVKYGVSGGTKRTVERNVRGVHRGADRVRVARAPPMPAVLVGLIQSAEDVFAHDHRVAGAVGDAGDLDRATVIDHAEG